MAGSRLGSVFVEISLDDKVYKQKLSELKPGMEATAKGLEKSWQALGVRTNKYFDDSRRAAENAYKLIQQSGKFTADEIVRAEKAKNAQLKALQEQQYGVQVGMMQKLKSNWIAVTAAMTAAYFAAQKAWNVADQAAQFDEQRAALSALGSQYGLTGKQIISSMKEAARGLISMKEAADMGAKAMNLAMNPDQIIRFTRVAEKLSDVTGEQLPAMFDRMAVAAASGRLMTLAQMGIVLDLKKAYEDYAKSVDKSTDSLSEAEKQQVRLDVILAASEKKASLLGETVDTNKDKMDRLKATVSDLSLMLGQGLVRAAGGAVGVYRSLNAASMVLSAGVWKTVEAYHALMEVVTFGESSTMHGQAAAYAKEQAEADMTAAGKYWESATDNFTAMVATTDELAGAMKQIPIVASNAGQAVTEEMQAALKSIRDVYTDQLELESSLVAHIRESRDEITGYVTNAANAGYTSIRETVIAEKELIAGLAKEEAEAITKAVIENKKDLSGLRDYWEHTVDNIHDATADAFYQIFSNIEEGFQTVIDNIKTWFLKLLAEMAAQAIARPIIIPIMSAIGSTLGISGTSYASSSGTGSGSGLFDLSGIGKLFSGAGAGWDVMSTSYPSILEMSRGAGAMTSINWTNVAGYIGLAYNAYSLFSSLSDGKYLSATGTALGTGVGAVLGGGPVGAAIGASLGNLVGGILDSVFGFGEGEPGFNLSHMQGRWSKERAQWTPGSGIGMAYINPNEVPLEQWASLGTGEAIQKAYVEGRDTISAEFNSRILGFLEALPEEYAKAAESALMGVDFNYLIPGGEWDVSKASEVLEALLQGYADFLDQVTDDLVRAVGRMYYSGEISTSDLYGKLTSGTQSAIQSMFMGGNMTGEEFQAFLNDWNTLLGVLASFEEFVNPSAAALSTFEQVTKAVGDQFDAYIDTLERAGVEVSKLGNLEQMRADVIERETSALQGSFWTDFISNMTLAYSGMSDYEKKVYQVTKQFEEYIAQAVDLGMSEDKIAEIREWEKKALESLVEAADTAVAAIEEVSYSLEQMSQLSNAMSLMSGGSGDTRMEQISTRYSWASYGSKYLPKTGGYNWENIINEILGMNLNLEGAEYIAKALGITLDQLLSDFDYIADTFTAMKQAAATTAASLEQGYMQATLSPEGFKKWQAEKKYNETTTQVRDWYRQGIIDYSEFTTMRAQALAIYEAEIDGLGDTFRDLIDKARNAWEDLADSISKSIYSLTTSSDNQADAVERLGIAAQAIRDYTGGASIQNYVASMNSDEDRRNAIEEMMSLYGSYLNIAQEAYQRPSSEYQAVYQEVLSAYQQMETMAEGYRTDFDIQTEQLEVLRQIAINTGLYGSYDTGTDYVPKTGPYLLHQGEKVTPAGKSEGGPVYFSLTINGSNMNPREARQEFETFLTSNRGRKMIQQAAARH